MRYSYNVIVNHNKKVNENPEVISFNIFPKISSMEYSNISYKNKKGWCKFCCSI